MPLAQKNWTLSTSIKKFQLNDHSLALFRIALGLLSLINVLVRASSPEFLPAVNAIDLSGAISRDHDGA